VKRLMIALSGAALISVTLVIAAARATPEPSLTPENWELKLEPAPPMRIQAGSGSAQGVYWYMLYKVTNHTGEDREFHPEVVRVNETASEVPADQAASKPAEAAKITVDPSIVGVPSAVFKAIKKLHAKTHPFLVQPYDAISTLRQGDDNAITSVIVFRDLDPRVSKFTIYFGGLSGEMKALPNPAYNPKLDAKSRRSDGENDANPKHFFLRKTLAMPYTLPGDPNTRRHATPSLGRMKWVMR
jgi:hypothetical protein